MTTCLSQGLYGGRLSLVFCHISGSILLSPPKVKQMLKDAFHVDQSYLFWLAGGINGSISSNSAFPQNHLDRDSSYWKLCFKNVNLGKSSKWAVTVASWTALARSSTLQTYHLHLGSKVPCFHFLQPMPGCFPYPHPALPNGSKQIALCSRAWLTY